MGQGEGERRMVRKDCEAAHLQVKTRKSNSILIFTRRLMSTLSVAEVYHQGVKSLCVRVGGGFKSI